MHSREQFPSKANNYSTSPPQKNPFARPPFPIQKQTHSSDSPQKTQEELDADYERVEHLEQHLANIPVNAPGTPPPEPPKPPPAFLQPKARAFSTGQPIFFHQGIYNREIRQRQELEQQKESKLQQKQESDKQQLSQTKTIQPVVEQVEPSNIQRLCSECEKEEKIQAKLTDDSPQKQELSDSWTSITETNSTSNS